MHFIIIQPCFIWNVIYVFLYYKTMGENYLLWWLSQTISSYHPVCSLTISTSNPHCLPISIVNSLPQTLTLLTSNYQPLTISTINSHCFQLKSVSSLCKYKCWKRASGGELCRDMTRPWGAMGKGGKIGFNEWMGESLISSGDNLRLRWWECRIERRKHDIMRQPP